MPVFHSSLTGTRLSTAQSVAFQARQCLAVASGKLGKFPLDSSGKAVFERWFGSARVVTDLTRVQNVISKMSHALNNTKFTISDCKGTCGATTNAQAHKLLLQDSSGTQQRGKAVSYNTLNTATWIEMDLCDNFFDGLPRIQSNDQTQLETFLHELSHLAAGTEDELYLGSEAYGRTAAMGLASNPNTISLARNNAENYGFFIVEAGEQTAVHSAKVGGKWATVQTTPRVTI